MKTESRELFELCKKVYEATGWKDTEQYLWLDDSHHNTHPEWDTIERSSHDMGGKGTPLYTSDYLLEKLPFPTEIGRDSFTWIGKYENRGKQVWERAGTPLKALLKLTLKLHEEDL